MNNISIQIKAFIGPLILIIIMCFMAFYVNKILTDTSQSINNISKQSIPKFIKVNNLLQELSRGHIKLFRYGSWAIGGVSGNELSNLGKNILITVDEVKKSMASLAQDKQGGDKSIVAINKIIESLDKYRVSVVNVIEVAAAEASVGVMMLGEADEYCINLLDLMGSLGWAINDNMVGSVNYLNVKSEQQSNFFIIISIAGALVGLIFSFIIAKTLVNPITKITSIMHRLADGDLSVNIPGTNRKDEIGEMVNSIVVFKNNALKMQTFEKKQQEDRAAAAAKRHEEMLDLASVFEKTVKSIADSLNTASKEMSDDAQLMAEAANDTKNQAHSAMERINKASESSGAVASTAGQMTASITEVSEQTVSSKETAINAIEYVDTISGKLNSLSSSVEEIGGILELIHHIAEETNLLALNATIESARAGEAGKGFAVVANEVKGLASQTAKATDKISSQIDEVRNSSYDVVESVTNITSIIKEIEEHTSVIAGAIDEQRTATSEILNNAEVANCGTKAVSNDISVLTKTALNTEKVAENVLAESEQISMLAIELSSSLDEFLTKVRNSY